MQEGTAMADMFNELSYVYEVYKERSFSKAAEKIYISQPALSAMIKKSREQGRTSALRPQHEPDPPDRVWRAVY